MNYIKYSRLALVLCYLLTLSLCSCSDRSDFIDEFVNYPNPFEASYEYTTFYVKTDDSTVAITKANVIIYSANGDELANLDMIVSDENFTEAKANWHGVDKNGGILPSTVYYAEVSVENTYGNISRSSTKTLIK